MLRIYPFIIETLKAVAPVIREIARHDADLAKQARRAASSIALNTAEAYRMARLLFLMAMLCACTSSPAECDHGNVPLYFHAPAACAFGATVWCTPYGKAADFLFR